MNQSKETPTPAPRTRGRVRIVQSHKPKHIEARFLVLDGGYLGKVYGHDGQPVEANAAHLTACWNAIEDHCSGNPEAVGRVFAVLRDMLMDYRLYVVNQDADLFDERIGANMEDAERELRAAGIEV